MANIQKRNGAFLITAYCGYDTRGKQIRRTTTWRPAEKMTDRQAEKEAQRQATLFEQSCKQGQVTTTIKFEDYTNQWFDTIANLELKESTITNYRNYSKKVNGAIGHMRIDKITPRDVQKFVLDLTDGKRVDRYKKGKLAPKTIKNHVAFASTIFESALRMQMITSNPCRAVTLPKVKFAEREIYTKAEMNHIFELLFQEPQKNLHYVLYITLAVFTGFRRGELLGLENRDIDFERQVVKINRTSNYNRDKGIFTDSPKTKSSFRALRLPPELMSFLLQYKEHQREYIESVGEIWVTHIKGINDELVPNDRLFTQADGKPMHPNAPSLFFGRFCKRHGLKFLSLHSLRHFTASALINARLDVKTVQLYLGHAACTTTLQIYTHEFQTAEAAAMDAIGSVIQLPISGSSLVEIAKE
jgi:integrase